jgi:hypothetical protein
MLITTDVNFNLDDFVYDWSLSLKAKIKKEFPKLTKEIIDWCIVNSVLMEKSSLYFWRQNYKIKEDKEEFKKAVRRCVIAYIRHRLTDYEKLLRVYKLDKAQARWRTQTEIEKWRKVYL